MTGRFCLIHGFAGSPASWDAVVALLPPESTVLCPTLLGHEPAVTLAAPASFPMPFAPDRPDPGPFDEEADRIARLIEDAGLSPLHLCGYSLGARVALGLLLRHPQHFTRATLIGVHPGLTTEAERAERWQHDEEWARILERDGLDGFIDHWESQPLFASQIRLPAEVRAARRARRLCLGAAGLCQSLRAHSLARMPDYRPLLPRVQVPLRLLSGQDDEKFRAISEDLTRLLPNAAVTVAAEAGHNIPLEAPQAVAAALLQID